MKFVIVSLLFSAVLFAEQNPSFRTYLVIERVTDETMVEMRLPQDQEFKAGQIGRKYEVPASHIQAGKFRVVVQMLKGREDILPCEIEIEHISQYDRKYVCTSRSQHPVAVQVRVFTNLNGGDRVYPAAMVAKK